MLKPGARVEFIFPEQVQQFKSGKKYVSPKRNTPYTVKRTIFDDGYEIVFLEEHVVGYNALGEEVGLISNVYRELKPEYTQIELYIFKNTVEK